MSPVGEPGNHISDNGDTDLKHNFRTHVFLYKMPYNLQLLTLPTSHGLPKTMLSSTRNDTFLQNLCCRLREIIIFNMKQLSATLLGTVSGLLLGTRCRGHGHPSVKAIQKLVSRAGEALCFRKKMASRLDETPSLRTDVLDQNSRAQKKHQKT